MGIDRFSPNQVEAIELLATGKNHSQVAKKVGVSIHAINKWTQDPNFNLEVKKLVKISYESAMQEMALLGCEAVEELRKIITSEETRPRDKLDAIKILFGAGDKFRDWTIYDANKQHNKGKLIF